MPYKDIQKQRAYQRQWRADRREQFLKNKHCIDCGTDNNLQIDHRDPRLKVHHNIWSWKHSRIIKELEKCDIRCAKCHSKKHCDPLIKHGLSGYQNRKCRCEICKLAKSKATKRETRHQK